MIPPTAQSPGPDEVQGNILKGHGRTYTALVFFRFARGAEAAAQNCRLLREAANGTRPEIAITSAAEQRQHTTLFLADPARQAEFRSLGLSAQGLAAGGFPPEKLGITGQLRADQFWQGASPELLDDHGEWHPAFAMNPHGVFMLAHNDAATRDRMADDAGRSLQQNYGVDRIEVEKGFRWMPLKESRDDTTYEHFGFADGFARTKLIAERTSPLAHLVDDHAVWMKNSVRPFEIPLTQVMIEEPGPFLGASFLVVHKIEQNVRAFLQAERTLAARLQALPEEVRPGQAGALFIGRDRQGIPLVHGARNRDQPFHFGGDPEGARCPFSAHIRKMNPRQNKFRGDSHPQAERVQQKAAQFVRRGVLYGDPTQVRLHWENPDDAPADKVGMLFMGYMSQIGGQFLKLLLTWGPSPDFPQKNSGIDALLGGAGKPWDWPQHPDFVQPKPFTLGTFLNSKGAGFFVVPPLHWLRSI